MIWLYSLVLFYFFLLYLIQLILIFLIWRDKKDRINIDQFPVVSVLIAARNEENNIIERLKSLEKLDWPEGKFEVLIGNDHSDDKTEELVRNFILDKPAFKLINITENLGVAKGKANVLAHLAKQAKGDFFCITDADIRVPASWIKGLVGTMEPDTGIVSGVTEVKGKSLFQRYQRMDWLYSLGMIRVMSVNGFPVSAVGNNMVVRREAYFSTGGYEKIPFSITEDFRLFRETLKKGWSYKNLLKEEVLAVTEPLQSLSQLFNQRKRWTSGAVQLPFILVFVLGMFAVFLPFLILALFFLPFGFLLWGLKFALQLMFTAIVLKRLNRSHYLKDMLIYELTAPVLAFFLILNFYLPGKIDWKGRKY